MLFYVYRGELIVLHQLAAQDDGVLEVVAFPAHERDQHVLPEREFAAAGGRAVRQHLSGAHDIALVDDGALVDAGALVAAQELQQSVRVHLAVFVHYADSVAGNLRYDAVDRGDYDLSAVSRYAAFHAGAHERRFGLEQRHSLPLHVRAHQRPVGVVVFKERYERGGNADKLHRRHIHVRDILRAFQPDAFAAPRFDVLGDELPLLIDGRARHSDVLALFAVRREIFDGAGRHGHIRLDLHHLLRQRGNPSQIAAVDHPALGQQFIAVQAYQVLRQRTALDVRVGIADFGQDLAIRRLDEAEFVGARISGERA